MTDTRITADPLVRPIDLDQMAVIAGDAAAQADSASPTGPGTG